MLRHDVGSVVVIEDKAPVGIITERDLLRSLGDADVLDKPVADLMTSGLMTAEPGMEIEEAFRLMNIRKIRRIPVVERGELVGIVTERDLMKWVERVGQE